MTNKIHRSALSTRQNLQKEERRGVDSNHHNINKPSLNRLTKLESNFDRTWDGTEQEVASTQAFANLKVRETHFFSGRQRVW
ncbi:MAG: hypothetical protein AAGA75_15300 [Cyanobacteria bacterium P01_E01_bin.6]